MADDDIHEVRLDVHAGGENGVTVGLEPTGMEYRLARDERIQVVVRGPGSGIVDVSHLPDTVVVCTWAGGTMSAYDADGNELPV